MTRRCLICANLNPCREHSAADQDAELARNLAEIARIRAAPEAPPLPQDVAELIERLQVEPRSQLCDDAANMLAALSQQPASVDLDVTARELLRAVPHRDNCPAASSIGRCRASCSRNRALTAIKSALARTSHAREAALRVALAKALFKLDYGMDLSRWDDDVRDFWLAKADAEILDQPAQAPTPKGE